MKKLFALPVAAALLMGWVGVAVAADMQQDGSSASKTMMQNNANASAQATTDVDMSYGGTMDDRTAAGSMHARQCSTGPRCNIYFGN